MGCALPCGFGGLSKAFLWARALCAGLTRMGMALHGMRAGGFTMVNDGVVIDNHTIGVKYARSKELLLRWCESSAVADAIFRTHPGLIPASSWQASSSLIIFLYYYYYYYYYYLLLLVAY